MDWVYLFSSFEGRISRKTFWIGIAVLIVAELAVYLIAEALQGDRLSAIADLAFIYPEFAIAVKRAHDRDLPIWILVAFFGGEAVLDLLTVLEMSGSSERPVMSLFIAVPFTVLLVALLIELGFRRGTIGPNQYGPDPVASH